MRATVTVSSQGKVTLPKALREKMNLEKGDVVEIEVLDDE
jgi:AbrB family looped-hinge helix DNA binding protein